jgi:hypothetical protein
VTIGSAGEGEKQLLLFFTSTCPMSRRTIPVWNEIALETEAQSRASVFGIQLDTMQLDLEYVDVNELKFPTLRLPDRRLHQWYRIGGVPVTVVLNHEGRVLYSKLGEISGQSVIDSVIAAVGDHDLGTAAFGSVSRNER